MKKYIISSLLASLLLLAGCGGNTSSDSSETSVVSSEAADISDGGIPVGGEEPAVSSAVSTTASEAPAQDGGIILKDPEYKKLKEMITFSGEFVNLSDIGADIREVSMSELSADNIYPVGADEEMLYYFMFEDLDSGDVKRWLMEYNTLTGVSEKACDRNMNSADLLYIDKDYIVYYLVSTDSSVEFRITMREDGTDKKMPQPYNGMEIYRIGKSLFFNYNGSIYDDATDEMYDVTAVYRYAPALDYLEVSCGNGVAYGASDFGMCLGMNGSIYYTNPVTDPYVSGEFPFSAAAMFMAGEYPTYTIQWDSNVLGDKYEVGYYPHYLVRKVLLRTQYSTEVYYTSVTSDKAAFVLLGEKNVDGECAAVIDTVNNKAALLDGIDGYNRVFSSGSYVHIITEPSTMHDISDERLITINTSNMGK